MKGVNAEALRQYLLNERQIGTICIQDNYLRIAYSSVDAEKIGELFTEIFEVTDKM